jgi:hypothetical protein
MKPPPVAPSLFLPGNQYPYPLASVPEFTSAHELSDEA